MLKQLTRNNTPTVRRRLEQIAAELGIDASDQDEPLGQLLVRLHRAAALTAIIDGRTATLRQFEKLETTINNLRPDDDTVDQPATKREEIENG